MLLHLILAQTPPPIDGVPSEFIKAFLQLSGFGVVIGLLVYNTFFRGTQKREISGRIVNEDEPDFADAEDVEDLQEGANEISARITQIQQAFAANLHTLGMQTLQGMSEIKVMASRHEEMIKQMEHRLSSLEKSHNESVLRLHARIDDAMKRK